MEKDREHLVEIVQVDQEIADSGTAAGRGTAHAYSASEQKSQVDYAPSVVAWSRDLVAHPCCGSLQAVDRSRLLWAVRQCRGMDRRAGDPVSTSTASSVKVGGISRIPSSGLEMNDQMTQTAQYLARHSRC